MRLIEQEYASKYLETLKIDTTQRNINLILKYHPLKKCKINASWNSSGLYADTISIIAKNNKKTQSENEDEKENDSDMLLKKLADSIQGKNKKGLKGSGLLDEDQKENGQDATDNENNNKKGKNLTQANNQKGFIKDKLKEKTLHTANIEEEDEDEFERKFKLDFSVESIKNKYIFPFNQTLRRSKI